MVCSMTFLSKIMLFGVIADKFPNFTKAQANKLKKSFQTTYGHKHIIDKLKRYASRLLYQPADSWMLATAGDRP